MVFYFSNPYMDGPKLEDITDEDFAQALDIAELFQHFGIDDIVIYVGF